MRAGLDSQHDFLTWPRGRCGLRNEQRFIEGFRQITRHHFLSRKEQVITAARVHAVIDQRLTGQIQRHAPNHPVELACQQVERAVRRGGTLAEPECVDQLRMNQALKQRVCKARVDDGRSRVDDDLIVRIERQRPDAIKAPGHVDLQHRCVPDKERRRLCRRENGHAERVEAQRRRRFRNACRRTKTL